MPWDPIKLNDGTEIPGLAFGTWKIGNGEGPISQVDTAISVGFSHIDTAQAYRNETEAGIAIRESGLARQDIFITTKYSGLNGLDITTSIRNSLNNLGIEYVDLYLIHHPRLAVPDIPTAWKQMEAIKAQGLVKNIGISNFGVKDLTILLASCSVKPVANQIMLQPYVYAEQLPTIEFCQKAGIVVEAYSPLIPIVVSPGGPVDEPVNKLAKKYSVTPDQILLAWTKSKGAVVITTSSKKERLEGYLNAGDLTLEPKELLSIDIAGTKGPNGARAEIRRMLLVFLFLGCLYYGLENISGL
ncbi:NADP-dependent oxidoreductase domain-containing protein [Mucidula mucida]|nr:NADP-dependent oxidoreductase domain-containing protein [Mucidula mucida]